MTGDEQLNNVSAESVGQQLRRAREKAGLSLAAVADQQHLRVSVIQAIESGDYSKIDTELFLKGYVRAYARQVGLDADSIIRDLDTELEPRRQEREQALQANPLVNIERRRRQKRRAAKLILVLVAAALIGFLAFTYLSNKDSALPATPQPEAEQPEAAEDPAGFQPDSTVTAPLIEADEPAVVLPGPQESVDESAPEAGQVMPEDGVTLEPDMAPATAPEADDQALETAPADVAAVAEPVPEETVAANEPPAAARLQMTFSDDCWIQVTDGAGNRLAAGLRTRGNQLDVSGEAPLRVVVGAMSAVETIQFRGETLDPGRFRVVNNRAEFTLEP
ncbi:DUF4115 domain-containing protein [Marinobacter sp. G11]|uniref:HTH cro/C1-type domain-containing protein n=1 Tax=Marinobacter vinifirmus TaxID=355591 RepID=A0A7Z1IM98_9GAMM|nr:MULTISPECIES: RodZ domain-containing protein [Marinobacter]MCE0758556.1 DUF4115 domain-containing protein [Marinobacter sp. G11]OZC36055.1 hypothetical protein B9Q17_17605 [Marinobacter vinifirmus]